jgi:hypothetical protein
VQPQASIRPQQQKMLVIEALHAALVAREE